MMRSVWGQLPFPESAQKGNELPFPRPQSGSDFNLQRARNAVSSHIVGRGGQPLEPVIGSLGPAGRRSVRFHIDVAIGPGLKKLLRDIENGVVDIVVCKALDRLARDAEDFAFLGKKLMYHRVALHIVFRGHVDEIEFAVAGLSGTIFLKH